VFPGLYFSTHCASFNDQSAAKLRFAANSKSNRRHHLHRTSTGQCRRVFATARIPRIPFAPLPEANDSLLIFDEVMTGFRLAKGGAQERFGIKPDLSCFGKIIGGGLPVGAFGGRAAIMDCLAPSGPVYQAGTLSGNPVAMAAGIAALEELASSDAYSKLERLGTQLEAG